MWLLKRFWQPLAWTLAIMLALWIIHRHGYSAGVRDERAAWIPQLIAAEKARAEADARTAAIEAAQNAATSNAEARHAATVQALNTRAADADRRIRGLVRDLAARSGRCDLPEVAGSEPGDAGAAEVERRAAEAGSRITGVGRDCADDAARVEFWTNWHAEQSALRR